MSEDKIRIDFEVNSEELKQITQAMQVLERFNKKSKELMQGLNGLNGSMGNNSGKAREQTKSLDDLNAAMQTWSSKIKSQQKDMSQYSQTTRKMTDSLNKLGYDAKVTADSSGKLSATFKDMNGNTVRMSGTLNELTNKISGMKTSITSSSDAVSKSNKNLKEMTQEQKKLERAMADGREKIQNQQRTVSNLATEYNKLHRGTKDLSSVLVANKGQFDVYNNSLQKNAQITKASIDANGKFTQTLKNERGELTTISGYYDKNNQRLTEYSRTVAKAGDSTQRINRESKEYKNQLSALERAQKGMNKSTLTWAESIDIATTRMLQWGVAGSVIFGVQNAFQGMISTIVELDTQMTSLRRVLDDDVNMEKLFEGSIRNASTLGIKLTEINESMIEFGRQGFDDTQIEKLVKATGMMKNVADMDMKSASENITAYIATFRKSVDDTMSYVDRLNEVDNKYAISVDQLASSIRKAGGTANAFGVSLDMVIGYTTAIGEATRESGNVIGNSLKTIMSRVTTLPNAAKALEAVGVQMTTLGGDTRKAEDIFNDLHKVWGNLTEAQKQNIGVQVAGRYQLNRFLIMMQNYDKALQAAGTAEKSWGSAQKENAKYMESLQAKINQLWSTLQLLAYAAGEAGVVGAFKLLLNTSTTMLQGILAIGQAMGNFAFLLPTVGAAVGAVAFNILKLKTNADLTMLSMNTAGVAVQQFGLKMGMSTTSATVLGGAVGRLAGGIKAMSLAFLTNPFTLLLSGASAIAYFVGQSKQLDDQMKTMNTTFKQSKTEYQSFLKSINEGTLDEYNINKYDTQVKALGDSITGMHNVMKSGIGVYEQQNNSMVAMKAGTETMGMSQKELEKHYLNSTLARKALSQEEMNSLATMGVTISKNTTMAEVLKATKDRQGEVKDAVEKAKTAYEKQRLEGIQPTADALNDYTEEIDENASALENAMGFTNKYLQSMKEQIAVVEILSGVENKNSVQKELLKSSTKYLNDVYGIRGDTIDQVVKKGKEEVASQEELLETAKKVADGTATSEELKRTQQLLTAQNTRETVRAQKQEYDAMYQQYDKNGKKISETAGIFKKRTKDMSKDSTIHTTATIINGQKERDQMQQTMDKMFNKSRTFKTTTDSNKKNLDSEGKAAVNNGKSHKQMADESMKSANVTNTASKSIANASQKDLGAAQKHVENTKKKYGELEKEAKNIPGGIAKGILNAIADPQKAIAKLAESLVTKFKKALGIKSPSRVFMALGGHVIDGLVNGLDVDNLKSLGQNAFKDFADGAFNSMDNIKMFLSGGGPGNFKNPGGGGAGWRSMIYAAAAQMGQSVTASEVNGIIAQINRESGGNQNITQSPLVRDINTRNGNPARGLTK